MYTSEQSAILSSAISGESFFISAVPGGGKTFIVKEIAKSLMQNNKDVLMLGFTNAAVNEMNVPGTFCTTTTKLTKMLLDQWYWSPNNRRRGKSFRSNNDFDKYSYLLRKVLKERIGTDDESRKEIAKLMKSGLRTLVDFARVHLAETVEDYEFIWGIISKDTFPNEFMSIVAEVLEEGYNRYVWNNNCDYQDLLWIPNHELIKGSIELDGVRWSDISTELRLRYKVKKQKIKSGKVWEYIEMPFPDVVIVDEFQDCTMAELKLVQQYYENGAQVILVGDQKQAIYGFRCALTNAVEVVQNLFPNIRELPITTTFRCPTSHSEYLNNWSVEVPNVGTIVVNDRIRSFHEDRIGTIEVGSLEQSFAHIVPKQTTFIGRNFAGKDSDIVPAISWIVKNTEFNIRLEGFDLWSNIEFVVNKMREFNDLSVASVRQKIVAEVENRIEEEENYFCDLNDLNDRLDFAELIINMCDYEIIDDIEKFVKFRMNASKADADIVFSTIHRIKGQTYSSVVILNYNKFPYISEKNTTEQNLQEVNIANVAFSRATETMFLVPVSQ